MTRIRQAQRTLDVVRQAVSQSIENGANIRYTSGVVLASSGYHCSAYLNASAYASEYIRLQSGQKVNAGTYVLVGQMGVDAWVDQILPDSMFSKMVIDHEHGTIGLSGTGDDEDWDFGSIGDFLISGGPAASAYWGSVPTPDFGEVGDIASEAFSDTALAGATGEVADAGHRHAMPADPVIAHVAASDPHTGYQKESEKGATGGYASLDSSTLVPKNQLGTGSPGTTTYLRGDGQWMAVSSAAPTFSGARVHRTSAQSIPDDTETNVTFPSGSAVEDFDTDNYHNMSTNTGRLTIPADGYYYVTGAAVFQTGTGYRQVYIYVDNTTVIASEKVERASGGYSTSVEASTPYYFTAGQYVDMKVMHNNGSSINLNSGDNTFLSVFALQGAEGPEGPQGPAGADGFYHHNQLSADTTWTVNHNLGRNPVVSVLDSAGSQIECSVSHTSINQVVLTLGYAMSGTADFS